MKKIFILLITLVFFISCTTKDKQELEKAKNLKKEIVEALNRETGDEFWFTQGFSKDTNASTNINYRAIVFSKKLQEMDSFHGVEIALEDLSIDPMKIEVIRQNYEGLIKSVEIDSVAEKKARELFGEKTNLYNDGMTTEHMYNNIMKNEKKDIPFEEKSGYYSTIINYFVDDLDKLDNEEIKKKTYELAKFIYDDMNYKTALQVYVRDDKYFADYGLVKWSINGNFINRKDIQELLKKIQEGKKLEEKEKVQLVRVFDKGGLDFDNCHLKFFLVSFKEKDKLPLVFGSVNYEMEKNDGEYIYFRKEGEN